MDLTLRTGAGQQIAVDRKASKPDGFSGSARIETSPTDRSALHGVPKSYVLFGETLPKLRKKLTTVEDFERRFHHRTGYRLFDFQRDAMKVLEKGQSVVVPARTSSGKTMVAEYAIEDALVEGKTVYYTSPRKAISNEKYFEFCAKYGEENVGMMTGDVTLRPNAPIVLMTTEILRNMLYQPGENKDRLKHLQSIVFDECHFMTDEERGMVWEEAILYARRELPQTQQIMLSATIGNSAEFTDWLNSLNSTGSEAGKFSCIGTDKRPVPLTEQYLTAGGRLVDIVGPDRKPTPEFIAAFSNTVSRRKKDSKAIGLFIPMQIVQALKAEKKLPLLEFVFGRKKCEGYARQTYENAAKLNLVTDEERAKIRAVIDGYVAAYPSMADSKLIPMLLEGIGYEHADMYFREKEMVGILRKEGLLKVSYATSAVAEGVNGPTRTVGISALDMALPTGWRPLSESEYQQATGRAGRLGMDQNPHGYAVLSHPQDDDMDRVVRLVNSKPNPIDSRFRILPYQTLNFVDRLSEPQIESILATNFKSFQAQKLVEQGPVVADDRKLSNKERKKLQRQAYQTGKPVDNDQLDKFRAMKDFLVETGFLMKKGGLTPVGKLSSAIPMESSLVIAKAMRKGLFDDLDAAELAGIISATVSPIQSQAQKQKEKEGFGDIGESSQSPVLADKLRKLDAIREDLLSKAAYDVEVDACMGAGAIDTVAAWVRKPDKKLLDESPGLLCYTILRTANVLKHIIDAPDIDPHLRDVATEAREKLIQGVVLEQVQPKRVNIGD